MYLFKLKIQEKKKFLLITFVSTCTMEKLEEKKMYSAATSAKEK